RTDLPALFLNTTVVEVGQPAVIGPYGVTGVNGPYQPPIFHLWSGAKDLRIPIPTALALSARFPYVTPPGRIDRIRSAPLDLPLPTRMRDWRFADGGYSDNTGIDTLLAVLESLRPAQDENGGPPLPLERVQGLVINA